MVFTDNCFLLDFVVSETWLLINRHTQGYSHCKRYDQGPCFILWSTTLLYVQKYLEGFSGRSWENGDCVPPWWFFDFCISPVKSDFYIQTTLHFNICYHTSCPYWTKQIKILVLGVYSWLGKRKIKNKANE